MEAPVKKKAKKRKKQKIFVQAGFFRRLSASMIDLTIAHMTLFALKAFELTYQQDAATFFEIPMFIMMGITLFIACGLPAILEATPLNASIGKWALGLQVQQKEGGSARALQKFIRSILKWPLFVITGSISVLLGIFGRDKRMLHDHLFATTVKRKRKAWIEEDSQSLVTP